MLLAVVFSGCAGTSWEATRDKNTVGAYNKFLRDNPESSHADEARERIEVLRVRNHLTIENFEEFQAQYPNSAYREDLTRDLEPLYFERAREANTPAAYRDFLSQYPNGALRRRALGNLSYVEQVRESPSSTNLREFVVGHPDSDFVKEARGTLEILQFKHATQIERLGLRVEVSPNVAQPERVRRGFASVVSEHYSNLGIELIVMQQGSVPTSEMDGWLRLDYEEAEASGVFGGQTLLSRCRVRLFHKSEPDKPVWDRTFEAPAEHVLKDQRGRDQTLFGNARYSFWERFFVPVSTWATSNTRVKRLDFLEDVAAVDVEGDRAALLFQRGGYNLIDISAPLEPKVIERYRHEQDLSSWKGIRILDDRHIAMFGPDGIEVIEQTSVGPKLKGKWELHEIGAIWGADIYGSTLLLAGAKGIHAVRLEQSVLTPHRLLEGEFVGVEVREPYIYLARSNRIEVTAPKYLLRHLSGSKVSLGAGFDAKKTRLMGNSLFVVGDKETVELSLENPGKPTVVTRLNAEKVGGISDVAGAGSHLFLLGDRGLQIAAADGSWIGDSIQVEAASGLEQRGRFAFLIGNRTLEVLDLGPYAMPQDNLPAASEEPPQPQE